MAQALPPSGAPVAALQKAEPSQTRPKGTRDVVVVGCKLPSGLRIQLRDNDGKVHEVKLNGSAAPVAPTLARPMPAHRISSTFGMTTVDKEMWEAWVAEHKSYPPLVKGFIFAAPRSDSADSKARERQAEKTGLEPRPRPAKAKDGEKNVVEPRVDD